MKATLRTAAALSALSRCSPPCGSSTSAADCRLELVSSSHPASSSSAATAAKFLAAWSPTPAASTTGPSTPRPGRACRRRQAPTATSGQVTCSPPRAATTRPNINHVHQQKCGIIVTVGFLMGDNTQTAAKANPNQKFAIVDYTTRPAVKNIDALVFNTVQDGFLGGYLAAGMSKTGKVATFGGQKLPTVTIYMDGYWDGVQYYNTEAPHARHRCSAGTRRPRTAASPATSPTRPRARRSPRRSSARAPTSSSRWRATSAWARPRRSRTRTPRRAARRST